MKVVRYLIRTGRLEAAADEVDLVEDPRFRTDFLIEVANAFAAKGNKDSARSLYVKALDYEASRDAPDAEVSEWIRERISLLFCNCPEK